MPVYACIYAHKISVYIFQLNRGAIHSAAHVMLLQISLSVLMKPSSLFTSQFERMSCMKIDVRGEVGVVCGSVSRGGVLEEAAGKTA